MDPTIKMMIQGYIDGLDSLKTGDAALKQDVEKFKKELTAFAEKPQQKHRPTPAEWLEPFRTTYDYIKALPVRERGLAVYRKLFEIGERHTDITEFLIEVEREILLWKLCTEDTLGILDIVLTGMDPLYKAITYPVLKNIEVWKASVCEADAYYLQDLLSEDLAKTAPRLRQREHYVICLGTHLMVYRGPNGKEGIMEMIATGRVSESDFKSKASNMAIAKLQARRTMEIIKKAIGLDFDDIMADEFLRYKLIATSNLCGLSRAYVQSNSIMKLFLTFPLPTLSLTSRP